MCHIARTGFECAIEKSAFSTWALGQGRARWDRSFETALCCDDIAYDTVHEQFCTHWRTKKSWQYSRDIYRSCILGMEERRLTFLHDLRAAPAVSAPPGGSGRAPPAKRIRFEQSLYYLNVTQSWGSPVCRRCHMREDTRAAHADTNTTGEKKGCK